jgi:hypothetical protein
MTTSFSQLKLPAATKRILKWLYRATPEELREGLAWYDDAMAFAELLSDTFGITKVMAAAIISALSPNNKWPRNKVDAWNLCEAYAKGLTLDDFKVCTYNSNKVRAWKIRSGEIKITKDSRKTYAFALNVGDRDESVVTLDKWMARAFSTTSLKPKDTPTTFTPKQYDRFETHFVKVAKRLGYKPYELQAIVWVVMRNRWLQVTD